MPIHAATSEDWRRVAQLLGDAAATESMHEIVEVLMQRMHGLFNAEIVIFDRLDGQMRQLAFQMHPAPTPELIRRAHPPFLAFFHQHPFRRDWVKTVGEGQVGMLSDRISGRDFRRTAFWNEAFIHLRGKNQLMVGGQIEPDCYWNFSMMRLGSDYGPRDREIAGFLQPHLSQLLQRQARRDRAGRALAVLDREGAAYLMADASGRILEISDQARTLLAKAGPAARGKIARLSARRVGICTETFGNLEAMWFRPAPQAPVFVMLGEAAATAGNDANKPSPREADILHWLGEGKSNGEIAIVLGISPRTVEKHCERLFAKLGVENRLAAALLARRAGNRTVP